MILTHPDLFVKWTLYNIESGKNIPSTKPSMKFRQKAGILAKMMIEKEAWKRQLVILENLSCETGKKTNFFVKLQRPISIFSPLNRFISFLLGFYIQIFVPVAF